jgi:hypothetical protein
MGSRFGLRGLDCRDQPRSRGRGAAALNECREPVQALLDTIEPTHQIAFVAALDRHESPAESAELSRERAKDRIVGHACRSRHSTGPARHVPAPSHRY